MSGTVTLKLNDSEELPVSADGAFAFETKLAEGAAFAVTFSTQPGGQTCSAAPASGTVETNDVSIAVTCVTQPTEFTLGGTATGITSGEVVVRDFDAPLGNKYVHITADGAFTFPGTRGDGYSYQIDILSNTTGLTCVLANDLGAVAGADVTNITVTCN